MCELSEEDARWKPAPDRFSVAEVLAHLSHSLVILALATPVMGNEEALDRMQAIRAGVPVIVSSGFGETEAARRFRGKHIAGFLQKRYTVSQLMESIAV